MATSRSKQKARAAARARSHAARLNAARLNAARLNAARLNAAQWPVFVPDFDLLEARKQLPTEQELVAIAAALASLFPEERSECHQWQQFSRFTSLEQRR